MRNSKNVKGIVLDKQKAGGRGGNNSNKFYGFNELDDGNESD